MHHVLQRPHWALEYILIDCLNISLSVQVPIKVISLTPIELLLMNWAFLFSNYFALIEYLPLRILIST